MEGGGHDWPPPFLFAPAKGPVGVVTFAPVAP